MEKDVGDVEPPVPEPLEPFGTFLIRKEHALFLYAMHAGNR